MTITMFATLFLSILPAHSLAASAEMEEGGDLEALESLLTVLDEQTDIATKTRMNVDFVPGLVTVLHGQEMLERGALTVWEALRFVPGIEPSIDKTGGRQVLVRGVGGGFASGNMKILLNGVPFNATLAATADPVLNLPLEQIKQIEVIRGPGSAVHGEFAYAGVINVMTLEDEQKGFVRGGSFDTYLVGVMGKVQPKSKSWSLNYNGSAWQTHGNRELYADDGLFNNPSYGGLQSQTNTPGYTNEGLQSRAMLMDFVYGDYGLSLKYVEDGHGDHYGTVHALSEPYSGISYRNKFLSLEGRGRLEVAKDVQLDAKLGWMHYANAIDLAILPYYHSMFKFSALDI
ncbi:TonB-dependent receptor plug domain-containing protein [Magnetococcus marinus]|nr:TonB-dependent receptor plug domain-containing protein [Magnetococcus marinus]